MLKKRLIGVVTIKNDWAVQSFGYQRYLPLGKPECLVENLDRWGADEILVQVIDRSSEAQGPDFELLDRLARLGLYTPLIYGGGIRSVDDGVRVIQRGADRLTVDALLRDDLSVVRGLANRLGAQAVIASLPLTMHKDKIEWLEYRHQTHEGLSKEILELLAKGEVSEALITDWEHEGQPHGFDMRLIQDFPLDNVPLIAFGGVSESEQMIGLLKESKLSAVAIGNFLNYQEHTIQKYKEALVGMPLRAAAYESECSLLADGPGSHLDSIVSDAKSRQRAEMCK